MNKEVKKTKKNKLIINKNDLDFDIQLKKDDGNKKKSSNDEINNDHEKESDKIKVASLFSGCGGLDYGFIKNKKYKHVFVNDFDKDACDTYEKNFGIKPICDDIKNIKNIPDFDLLLGGFPCQGFSMVNPYRSEKDERNKLYLEILRILNNKKPSYFLLENVKGLMNLGGYETNEDKKNKTGKVFKIIINDLEKCGYNVMFKLFDIKNYDVPQKRQRVIIIGVRKNLNFISKIKK